MDELHDMINEVLSSAPSLFASARRPQQGPASHSAPRRAPPPFMSSSRLDEEYAAEDERLRQAEEAMDAMPAAQEDVPTPSVTASVVPNKVTAPGFMGGGSDVSQLLRDHQERAEASRRLKGALSALKEHTAMLRAIMMRPGISATPEAIVEAMDTLMKAQTIVARRVAESMRTASNDESIPLDTVAMQRLEYAVGPMIYLAWERGETLNEETLNGLATMATLLIERSPDPAGHTVDLHVVNNVRDVDRELAMISASLTVTKGVDHLFKEASERDVKPILMDIMTGGQDRKAIIREIVQKVESITEQHTQRLLDQHDPKGLTTEREQQIVFRGVLRAVSQITEALLKNEGIAPIIESIKKTYTEIKEKDIRLEEAFPQGAILAWFERALPDHLEAIPAFRMEKPTGQPSM